MDAVLHLEADTRGSLFLEADFGGRLYLRDVLVICNLKLVVISFQNRHRPPVNKPGDPPKVGGPSSEAVKPNH